MLAKKYRGLTASEVGQLFRDHQHSSGNRFFRVLWSKSEDPFSRFVVITTGKFHKSAVVRNRYRRAVYEMIRQTFSRWTEGYRVAIVVKTPAIEAKKKAFAEAFDELMKRSRLV